MKMGRLHDKVALVSGAARGIGLAVARAFVAEGARVALSDVRDDEGLAATATLGSLASYLHLDVREERDWIATVDEVLERYGRMDVLVNNAGITGLEGGGVLGNPEDLTLQHWREVMATNLEGVMLGCKHGIRAMRKTGTGSIINMSSRSGLVGIPGAAAYAASKAGVRNHSKSVALWCAQEGLAIRCNSVHPAAILTPMWEPLLGSGPEREARMRAMVADTPLRRFGTPEEVAALCVHLAADESAYTTGCEFNVDGGLLAGSAASPGGKR
jgi:NAD(P)-dependent dehydrogenase (short-subunit alcohol dehydrogenase family)